MKNKENVVTLTIAWLVYFCNIGVITYGISAITAAMVGDSVLGRAQVAVAVALCTAMQGLVGPLTGRIIVRRGVRTALFLGNSLLGMSFLALGCGICREPWFLLLYGMGVGIGMGLAGNVAVQSLVNQQFTEKRSMAIAVTLSSGGVGGFLGPILLRDIILRQDWRVAWMAVGVLDLSLALLSLLLIRSRPMARTERESLIRPRELFRLRSFRLIMLNYVSRTAIYYSFSGCAVLFMQSREVAYSQAVSAMSLVSLVSLFARLLTGFVADRWLPSHDTLGLGNIGMAAGVLIIACGAPFPLAVFGGAAVFGVGVGLVNVSLPLTFAAFYGQNNFAVVSGYATPLNYLIGACGPLLVGIMDGTGGGFWIFTAIALFSSLGGMAALKAKPEAQFREDNNKKVVTRGN